MHFRGKMGLVGRERLFGPPEAPPLATLHTAAEGIRSALAGGPDGAAPVPAEYRRLAARLLGREADRGAPRAEATPRARVLAAFDRSMQALYAADRPGLARRLRLDDGDTIGNGRLEEYEARRAVRREPEAEAVLEALRFARGLEPLTELRRPARSIRLQTRDAEPVSLPPEQQQLERLRHADRPGRVELRIGAPELDGVVLKAGVTSLRLELPDAALPLAEGARLEAGGFALRYAGGVLSGERTDTRHIPSLGVRPLSWRETTRFRLEIDAGLDQPRRFELETHSGGGPTPERRERHLELRF